MAGDKGSVVIVKKVKGGHGDGHHGGSWKVAIADFAIAMMALFLVLWLLAVTDEQQKEVISSYFSDPGSFTKQGSAHPIDLGGSPNIIQDMSLSGPNGQGKDGTEVVGDMQAPQRGEKVEFEELVKELQKMLSGVKDEKHLDEYVFMEVLPEGLRLVILDHDEDHMFESGSSRLTPFYEDLLIALGKVLSKTESAIMVSGHTDATPTRVYRYSNWNLSGERALMAQKILNFGGVPDEQFIMVAALSDHEPRIPDDPFDGSNRRVELMILNDFMAQRIKRLFAPVEQNGLPKKSPIPEADLEQADQEAHDNQIPEIYIPE
ncbi:flagellar motor protein MotB [Parendozoicomonas haliclonae]|uniref:Chemotaxis protein LafU n=1 Tax=Parendozoicomonas haliclonae TaxID=1960125 RepID=A0A1X7AH70_9GAMM|nr:flagellar motor protein MotB [Parendozoicomonas haliclonae]SMA39809.1 Chemotaxis protein LafU [Parendozoicomonas haliclonae]